MAVKVLRKGLDTEDVIARFQTERKILAGLEHPRIARILDAGETPDGEWHGWGNKIGQVGRTALGFFTKTRWSRTFHLIR